MNETDRNRPFTETENDPPYVAIENFVVLALAYQAEILCHVVGNLSTGFVPLIHDKPGKNA